MPYTTELTQDYMGIVHMGTGVVTGEDVLAGSRAVAQLVQNTANFHYELVDFSGATEVRISPAHLQAIAEQDRFAAFFRPHAMVVIVAPTEELLAVARQWEALVENLGWSIHIARDRTAAVQWLAKNFRPEAIDVPQQAERA